MTPYLNHRQLGFLAGLLLLLICVSLVSALEIGDKAPDFQLPSTTGENVSLGQFKGKKHVLIQFYTLEFNPT